MKYVLSGKSCISLLDAKKCSTKFWCSAADDSALCEASEDIHISASYEESSLWALPRIQGDTVGQFYIPVCLYDQRV